jgi:hypothetical protein
MLICRSSGAYEVWLYECYKNHAPPALKAENVNSKTFNLRTVSNNSFATHVFALRRNPHLLLRNHFIKIQNQTRRCCICRQF